METTDLHAFVETVTAAALAAGPGLAARLTRGSTSEIERFRLIWNLRSVQESGFEPSGGCAKNKELSNTCRAEGNALCRKSNISEAINMYTAAICTAPYPIHTAYDVDQGGFPELAYAYANRSALVYSIGRYHYSLYDIMRAVALNYPEHLMHKLLERQGLCFLAMHEYQKALNCFSAAKAKCPDAKKVSELETHIAKARSMLTSKTKSKSTLEDDFFPIPWSKIPAVAGAVAAKVPALSDAVDIESDDGEFIAKRDIEPGEVILTESPVGFGVLGKHNCYHCLRRTLYPVPCRGCTVVCYCLEKCQTDAWDQYHKYECPVIIAISENTDKSESEELLLLKTAVNTVISSSVKFISDVKKIGGDAGRIDRFLQKFIAKKNQDGFLIGTNERYFIPELFTLDKVVNHGILAAFALKVILQSTTLLEELSDTPFVEVLDRVCRTSGRESEGACVPEEGVEKLAGEVSQLTLHNSKQMTKKVAKVGEKLLLYVGSAIMHQVHLIRQTAREITEEHSVGDSFGKLQIGLGSYAHARHLTHSCCANAFEVSYGKTIVITAIAPIRKGYLITVGRVPYLCYDDLPIDKRRRLLKLDWQIACECTACVERWPTLVEFTEQRELGERASLFICQQCGASVRIQDIVVGKCPSCAQPTQRGLKSFEQHRKKWNTVMEPFIGKMERGTASVDEVREALKSTCKFAKAAAHYYRPPSQML